MDGSAAREPCASDIGSPHLSHRPSDGSASRAPGAPADARARGGSPEGRRSPGHPGAPAASAPVREEPLTEIEELRYENDFLKDKVEKLRAEMLEAKDSFVEEEAHELQKLRRQLRCAKKSCHILQYQLRKAEHRDPQGTSWLEQELQITKDTSVRLHKELERAEERCCRVEDENEALRHRVLEEEVAREALQEALWRAQQSDVKRGGSGETHKEQKSVDQEDSAELRARLLSAREENAVLLRKVTRLSRRKDELEQELCRYRCMLGDADGAALPGDTAAGAPPSTREGELQLRLQLVEEEADMLARKVVELEAENRAARAENEDLRRCSNRDFREWGSSSAPYNACGLERVAKSCHPLSFAEEEVAPPGDTEEGCVTETPAQEDGIPGSGGGQCCVDVRVAPREQLSEDGVLSSSMWHCSLSSHPGAKECSGQEAAGENECRGQREGPIGGESGSESSFEGVPSVDGHDGGETLCYLKQEVRCLESAADLLIAHSNRLLRNGQQEAMGGQVSGGDVLTDRLSANGESKSRGLNAISARVSAFRTELLSFMKKLEDLGARVPLGHGGTVHRPPGAAVHDGPEQPVSERDATSNLHYGLRAEPHGPSEEEHPSVDSSRGDGGGEWSGAGYQSAELQGVLSMPEEDGDSSRSSPSGRSGSGTWALATGDGAWGRRHGTGRNSQTSENLLLEALCLDHLGRDGTSSLSGLRVEDSESTESRRRQSGLQRKEMRSGNLLRVKTICSMSDFQRLMDSSPFLADTGATAGQDGDEASPLLEDRSYLDEFETRGGDMAGALDSGSQGAPETVLNPAEPSQPLFGCCAGGNNHGTSITQEHGTCPVQKSSTDKAPERPEVCECLRTRPRKRSCKDQASQTDPGKKTQSSRTVSLGLQMEPPRRTATNPKQCLTPRGGATPASSPCRNTQGAPYTPAAQNHLEPNHGAHSQRRAHANGRAATVLPSQGAGESAWARSTTTRDSPVHGSPWDRLSSLFSVVDHPATATGSRGARKTRTAGRRAAERPPGARRLISKRKDDSQEVTGTRQSQELSEDSSSVLDKRGREERRTGGRSLTSRGQKRASKPCIAAASAPWRP